MKDYIHLPATLTWQLTTHASFSGIGDFDGDGRSEMMVSDSVLGAPCMAALSYFSYSDLSAGWGGSAMTVAGSSQAAIDAAPGGTAWALTGEEIRYAVDLDGDGTDEVVLFDASRGLLGVAKWFGGSDSRAPQLRLLWSGIQVSGGWQIGADNLFFPIWQDFGQQKGLVAYSPGDQSFAILTWSGGEMQAAPPFLLSGLGMSSSVDLYAGTFVGQASQAILARDRDQGMLWLLAGDGTTFTAITSQNMGFWEISSNAQIFIADVDGDGTHEIVLFDFEAVRLNLVKWYPPNQNLRLVSSTSSTIPPHGASNGWQMAGSDQYAVQHVAFPQSSGVQSTGNGSRDQFVVFNSGNLWIGVIGYSADAGFQLYWAAPNQVAAGSGAWKLANNDQIMLADLDGDGTDEVLFFNPGLFLLVASTMGVAHWDGTQLQTIWTTSAIVPGWSIALLAEGPKVRLTPFEGVRNDIYIYISNQANSASDGDLRKLYENGGDASSYSGWSSYIRGLSKPDNHWSEDDWKFVQDILGLETAAEAKLWQLVIDLDSELLDMNGQQTDDYGYVYGMVQPEPVPANFWAGQIADAFLWGLAAAPLGPGLQIPLSMIASLYGSELSWTASQPTSEVIGSTCTAIQDAYTSAKAAVGKHGNTLAYNETALHVLFDLCDQGWQWSYATEPIAVADSQNSNRRLYYSNLVSALYQVMYWQNDPYNYPGYDKTLGKGSDYVNINAPACAWQAQAGNGYYSIQMLYSGPADISQYQNFKYPLQAMMQDLWTNLDVNPNDLFFSQGLWWELNQVPADSSSSTEMRKAVAAIG